MEVFWCVCFYIIVIDHHLVDMYQEVVPWQPMVVPVKWLEEKTLSWVVTRNENDDNE